jgi:hypothetical protein
MSCTTSPRPTAEWLEPLLDAIAEAAPELARREFASFQNKVHLALNPKPEKPPRLAGRRRQGDVLMGFAAASSGCPMSASRRCSMLWSAPPRRRPRTIPSRRSPNVGEVAVPDPRLEELARISKSPAVVPTRIQFVDIAGLVRGASKGEGLGNRFLANIREVDAIVHVVRCFEDPDVTHVEGRVDPDRRHRDHRDRAHAGRSRQSGAPHRAAAEASGKETRRRARRWS